MCKVPHTQYLICDQHSARQTAVYPLLLFRLNSLFKGRLWSFSSLLTFNIVNTDLVDFPTTTTELYQTYECFPFKPVILKPPYLFQCFLCLKMYLDFFLLIFNLQVFFFFFAKITTRMKMNTYIITFIYSTNFH